MRGENITRHINHGTEEDYFPMTQRKKKNPARKTTAANNGTDAIPKMIRTGKKNPIKTAKNFGQHIPSPPIKSLSLSYTQE